MRIVVIGAGGLGSYVGAVAAQAGHDVTLVARGPHRTAIEEHGLHVRSHAGDFVVHPRCVGDASETHGAELALVVTKTFSLDEVASQLRHLSVGGAHIVSLLNGVNAVTRLHDHGIGLEQMADGAAYMTSFRVAPGVVERKASHQRIVLPSPGENAAAALMADAFGDTLVGIEHVDDIRIELWEKLAVVSPLSVLCAIGDGSMGSIRAHPYGASLQSAAIREVLDVGRSTGVPIPASSDEEIDARLDRFPDSFFPSVIHDLNEQRRTEMPDLGGEVVRLGLKHGVPTPLHEVGTLRVEQAEARYRG
ncbi:MAG: ketopantoate reductase family protein [Gemmatimonadota bacterium]